MRKSNELQIGKAGEYIVCADLIMKGLIAFPSEQGLPYDVVVDTGKRILRCQVKTTGCPRRIPQRDKVSHAYIFNIKRHGKKNTKRYDDNEVDVFALVELETRTVAYLKNGDMPETLNLRVDGMRGSYYDEKGIVDHAKANELFKTVKVKSEVARQLGISISQAHKMLQDGFVPFKSTAPYFSDLFKTVEWFYAL